MMEIAIIGWGSLIWCPGSLRIRTGWRSDGPELPIEFARISQDNRLTLVIHPDSPNLPTYWALSEFTTLKEARSNLRVRESCKSEDIRSVERNGRPIDGESEIVQVVREWLAGRDDLDAAVWTGLPSNWMEKRGRDFTPEDAVAFLTGLEADRDRAKATYERAREYLTNAPPSVDTAVRKALRARGWHDAQLSRILFDAPPENEVVASDSNNR